MKSKSKSKIGNVESKSEWKRKSHARILGGMAWRLRWTLLPAAALPAIRFKGFPAVCGISAGRASAPAIDPMSVVDVRGKSRREEGNTETRRHRDGEY